MDDPFDWQAVYPRGLTRELPALEQAWDAVLQSADASDATARVALTSADGDMTYRDLHIGATDRATRLRTLSAEPSERVLLIRHANGSAFACAVFGAYLAGWKVVAVSPDAPESVLREIVTDASPSVVACPKSDRATLRRIAPTIRLLDEIRVVAEPSVATCPAIASHGPRSGKDVAVLQYTSGTTGGRKAARMSQRNLMANALQNNLWFDWTPDDVVLGALPFCHTWGLSCVLHAAVLARARIVVIERFDADEVLAAIEREQITVAYGSATMWHRLLDAAGASAARVFCSLRYVKAGAMLVGGDLADRWARAVPEVPMVLGYGLTEASPEVCNNPLHAPRPGTVGVPLPGTEIRLRAPDDPDGEDVAQGELQVRGPQVTSGYHNRPDATSAAFTADGWLRTGDVARFDDAGYVVIVDRLKDLIKFRGYSIAPAVVEAALRVHPGVRDAVVVGVTDNVDGEVPVAFVETAPGCDPPSDEALHALAAERLARYEAPRMFVSIDAIPRNHVGKPLRRVLRDRANL